jgi:hypothetical protein
MFYKLIVSSFIFVPIFILSKLKWYVSKGLFVIEPFQWKTVTLYFRLQSVRSLPFLYYTQAGNISFYNSIIRPDPVCQLSSEEDGLMFQIHRETITKVFQRLAGSRCTPFLFLSVCRRIEMIDQLVNQYEFRNLIV